MRATNDNQPPSSTRLDLALLIGVLILATLLRFWGLRFGLPYFEHPDEWAVADEALRMLRTGNYSPLSFTYPTLYVYLQVGVAGLHFLWGRALGQYANLTAIDPASYYVWARGLTALLGVGTVGLTYMLTRRMAARAAGLLAATFLAVLPTAVGDAHYVTVDTPAAFFTVLALLAISRLTDPDPQQRTKPALEQAFLAGVVVGLAASTKYNAGVLIFPLAAGILLAWRGRTARSTSELLVLAGVSALGGVVGFTLGTPLWIPDLGRILEDIAGIARHYRETGHPGAESSRPALFYWDAIRFEAPLLPWVALVGVFLALWRRNRFDLLLLAFVVPYVLQLSSVRVVFFRNAVPFLPSVCVLAAIALVWLAGKLSTVLAQRFRHNLAWLPRVLLVVGLGVVAAQPLAKASRDEWLRAQPTTRVLATEWVLAHALPGTRIWLEDQTLILPDRLRVQGGRPLTNQTAAWYSEHGFRFLVANASIAKSDPEQLKNFGEPVARFSADGQRYGHTFLIYDTGFGDVSREPRTHSGATLANAAIVLDGYRYTATVAPGATLPLALYWQSNRVVALNYTVFVHLIDAQGAKLAQRDLPPLEGSRPTSGWQVGEVLRDDQDLAIPVTVPPGRYRLVVGMYDPQTFAAVTDTGPIDLGEVVVR